MYDLGDQFKLDLDAATANLDCVFKGDKYRITVLTERLIRLEYNENGIFNDYPTELAWYRNFSKPEFKVEENNKFLKITTKYFELNYLKNKKFYSGKLVPYNNLKISLLGTNKFWYYMHPEARNYNSCVYKADKDSKIESQKSLYSVDGFSTIDDSKSSIILENGVFKKRENNGIDLYVFLYNKDFYLCLNDYFMLTGYPPLPSRYALGNWWCKDDFYNELELTRMVRKFKSNNVPISLFLLNKLESSNSLEFSDYYKDPLSVIKYLKNNNIRVGISLNDPIEFKPNSKNYDKLKEYLPPDKKGNIPFNLFDSRIIDAYLKLIIHPLYSFDINFYSLDSFNKKELQRQMMLKHYLYYDNSKGINRPLISGYNSTLAAHRYSVLYSGKSNVNWDSLKDIISFNISAFGLGISYWSHDLGGSSGGIEDSELFIRFIELGVFSPILRLGSDSGKYYKREPWEWDIKTCVVVTKFLNLRYSLIPYLYTECYKYYKYGKPLIQPLYYRYQDLYDDDLYNKEYFFGDAFLIAPIISKKDKIMNRVIHKIFVPEGIWYDYFTGKKYTGNKRYVSFYRDEEYPIFVKAGSIIPISLNKFNDISIPKKLEIQVFPGRDNTYSIYEDDGITNNYLNGEYLITNVEFAYQPNNYKLTILPVSGKAGIAPKERDYKIRFKNTRRVSKISSYIGSVQVRNESYLDGTDLVVEVNNVPTTSQFTLIISGDRIEISAIRIINEDIASIISDLPIKTIVKARIDSIMFSKNLTLQKKRIDIRKLSHGKDYLERKYIQLFLKLLEYINEI